MPDQHTAPDAEPQEREFTVWRCPAGHVCNAPSDPAIEVVECGECGGDGVTWHRPVTVVPKSALTAVERRADSLKLRLLDEADKRKAQAARANAAERRADRAEEALRELREPGLDPKDRRRIIDAALNPSDPSPERQPETVEGETNRETADRNLRRYAESLRRGQGNPGVIRRKLDDWLEYRKREQDNGTLDERTKL